MEKIISKEILLTYDDVLLVPRMSLDSRDSADTSTTFLTRHCQHPIIPANMDTIASRALLLEASRLGGVAICHRYMPFEERVGILDENPDIFISVGVSDDEVAKISALIRSKRFPILRICVDIAHAHSTKVSRIVNDINYLRRQEDLDIDLVVGNVATVEGFEFLANLGVSAVKVGIGPGSLCTTRIVTGCGIPQLSAIMQICQRRNDITEEYGYIPIIADGGIKNSGDIVKAIAGGADMVMTGSLFAGCSETPGDPININGKMYKQYRGMASRESQIGWFGGDVVTPEGETTLVPARGQFSEILANLLGGLKSGMSYTGCGNLDSLKRNARFVQVTTNTLIENRPHGKL